MIVPLYLPPPSLSNRYVDEVVIGSPMDITRDVVTTFNISIVVRGDVSETSGAKPLDPVGNLKLDPVGCDC